MVKVAICDDDAKQCTYIEDAVKEYGMRNAINLQVEIYAAGEDLYSEMKNGEYFDIIFLDIELKAINGVEVGRMIRDELKNNLVQIIFISSHKQYAQQLFIARPIQFLIKPFDVKTIEEMLSKSLYLMQYQEQFTYQINKAYFKVAVNDIIYFRSLKNRVEMVCTNQNVIFYESLGNIYKKLRANHFFYSHRSFLVNFRHMMCMQSHEIILTNGDSLPVGRYREDEWNIYKELFTKDI